MYDIWNRPSAAHKQAHFINMALHIHRMAKYNTLVTGYGFCPGEFLIYIQYNVSCAGFGRLRGVIDIMFLVSTHMLSNVTKAYSLPWCLQMSWRKIYIRPLAFITLHWRHNEHNGVSNHQPHTFLLKRLFRSRSKKTSRLRVTGLLCGEFTGDRWPVNSPHKWPVTRKMFQFDDVIMTWLDCDCIV